MSRSCIQSMIGLGWRGLPEVRVRESWLEVNEGDCSGLVYGQLSGLDTQCRFFADEYVVSDDSLVNVECKRGNVIIH